MDNSSGRPVKRPRVINDIVFIASFLAVVIITGLCLFLFRADGDTVTVTVDGAVQGTYPLDEDITVEIRSDYGINVLVIKDGLAFVEAATCPDKICVSHKPILRDGETVVCLPNRVVISVSTSEDSPDIIV